MTLNPPEIRAAKALLSAHRKAVKATRPKPVIPTAKGQRKPRMRDNGFLAYTRRQPCAVGPAGCVGPTQAAHIRTPKPGEPPTGMGRKPDDCRITALCAGHHAEQHSGSEMAFWRRHGKDPFDIAAALYQQFKGQTP